MGWTQTIDNGLGVLLVLLTARFFRCIIQQDDDTLQVFGLCFVGTVIAINLCSWTAGVLGVAISKWRDRDDLPKECRNPLGTAVAIKKWKDQSWQLCIHVSMSAYEFYLLHDNTWWQDPMSMYDPCPPEQVHSPALRNFYLIQLAIWMWTAFSCKWLEERRKDYLEMMAHHVITVALVSNSYVENQHRFGMLILVVHDLSDVFLDVMKMANYLKIEGPSGLFATEIAFVVNTYVSWPFLRFYKFITLIYTVAIPYKALCPHAAQDGGATMLCMLLCLHIHWWMILQRIALKILKGGDPSQAGDEEYEVVEQKKTK